jgi:crotonobetaine/carnitine-CoA ligase
MTPATMPPASQVVLRFVLERNAEERPDEPCILFEDGSSWTRAETLRQAYSAGNALLAAGVEAGQRISVFLPNGPDFCRSWFGLAAIGATIVPVNTAFRGDALRHLLELVDSPVVVTDKTLGERLDEIDFPVRALAPDGLHGPDTAPPVPEDFGPWSEASVILTSGTTGPSKASLTSYHQLYLTGAWATVDIGLGESDTFLIDLPLFHQAASSMTLGALAARSRIAVRSAPALNDYWRTAKESGATMAFLLSSMAAYLAAQPAGPADTDHGLRHMIAAPLPADPEAFCARFGLADLITAFGSTEVSGCLVRRPGDPLVPGAVGRLRPGYEVRLVDDHDIEVPAGEPGELVVRTEMPWSLSSGYLKAPDATAAAWRNGWFHTGDVLRTDGEGNYFFHDRHKDCLRRRGENVSSFDVERSVAGHPDVAEVACVAVPSELGVDDDVKVWIVPAATGKVDFAALVEYLAGRMPHFMVPRYYELIDALPKTPTMRVMKHLLRDRGNGDATWDREAAGLHISREGLARR